MARIKPPTQDHLHTFAKVAHECFISMVGKSESRPTYALLVPRDAEFGLLEVLEISPCHRFRAVKVDDHYVAGELRGAPSLVMIPFTIEGDLYDHLQYMTLPKSALALSLSTEMWVKCLKTDDSGEPIGDINTVEPITGYNTFVVARDTHTLTLTTFGGEEGMQELETTSVGGRTATAMKEMMIRSGK